MRPTKIANYAVYAAVLLPYIVLGLLRVYAGLVIGDEGWYLLSAVNVLDGKKPYEDFLFTQTPFLPYFYAGFIFLLGRSLIVARWVSFALGGISLVLIMKTCHRKGGLWAGVAVGLLLSLNLSFIFDVASMKTQALTVFLVSASLYTFSGEKTSFAKAVVGLALMNLAVLTRLSMLPVLVVIWVYGFWAFRKNLRPCAVLLVVNCLIAAALLGYFYSGGNLIFGIYHFHSEYFDNAPWKFERLRAFLVNFARNQLPLIACGAWAIFTYLRQSIDAGRRRHPAFEQHGRFILMLSVCYVLTTIIHASPLLPHATYQTSNIPFIAIISGLMLGHLIVTSSPKYAILPAVIVLLLATTGLQDYRAFRKGAGAPARIKEAAEIIRNASNDSESILTLNVELAVESDRPLLPGYELSEFSYFWNMSDDRAAQLKVVNFSRLLQDVTLRKAKIVCMTDRGVVLLGGENQKKLRDAVNANYRRLAIVEKYGQFRRPLLILLLRQPTTQKATSRISGETQPTGLEP